MRSVTTSTSVERRDRNALKMRSRRLWAGKVRPGKAGRPRKKAEECKADQLEMQPDPYFKRVPAIPVWIQRYL